MGMDEAFITPYDVLLSYPETQDESKMNQIFVYDALNQELWKSALYEPILDPSENKSHVVPPFNAYSAPGDVSSVGTFGLKCKRDFSLKCSVYPDKRFIDSLRARA